MLEPARGGGGGGGDVSRLISVANYHAAIIARVCVFICLQHEF